MSEASGNNQDPTYNQDWTPEQNRRYDEAETRTTPQLARREAGVVDQRSTTAPKRQPTRRGGYAGVRGEIIDSDKRVEAQRELDRQRDQLLKEPQTEEEAQLGAEQARAMVERLTKQNLKNIADRNDFELSPEASEQPAQPENQ